jgi:hypothetical protein
LLDDYNVWNHSVLLNESLKEVNTPRVLEIDITLSLAKYRNYYKVFMDDYKGWGHPELHDESWKLVPNGSEYSKGLCRLI